MRNTGRTYLVLWSLLVAGATASLGQSTFCDAYVMTQLSPQPAIAGVTLSVRTFGSWPVMSAPALTSSSVNGTDIRVQLEGLTGGPQSVLPFWEDTVAIGALASGSYDIYVDVLVNQGTGLEMSFVCGPTSHSVAAAIPAASHVGLALFVALIAALGVLRLL